MKMIKFISQIIGEVKKPVSINFFIKLTASATAIITALFIVAVIKNSKYGFDDFDPTITGQIGDFFGGVIGSLLTFLSFLYILKTFEIQKDQIKIQKDELIANQYNYLYKFIDDKWNELFNVRLEVGVKNVLGRLKDNNIDNDSSADFFSIPEIGLNKIIKNFELIVSFREQCKGLLFEDIILDIESKAKLFNKVNEASDFCKEEYKLIMEIDIENYINYEYYENLKKVKELYTQIKYLAA